MTTAVQVQYRRGTASQVASFTGAQGEMVVDTTNNRVVMQDGTTAGGWPAAKLSEVVTNTRTPVSDAAYTALTTDRMVAYTALTAARVVTLPAASAYPTGTALWIVDETGNCSSTKTITVSRAGSDTIDGGAGFVLNAAYASLAIESNGANAWTVLSPEPNVIASLVGIGTPPDPNNPLSVYGPSALFNGASNFNVTVNKGGSAGASSDTASFVFEDGFSGRAQIGLCGDDNFHFKVSPNGSTWYDALDIVSSSGLVDVNYGLSLLGGELMIGNNTPTAPLTITSQTATLPTPNAGTQLHLIGANSTTAAIQWNSYAANGVFIFERADGVLGTESALVNADVIGAISFRGYNGSAYSGNQAVINVKAVGNWVSGSNLGTVMVFNTTPVNTTANTAAMSLYAGVVIGTGTTDPGAGNLTVGGAMQVGVPTGGVLSSGTINVAGGIYLNNTAYTNPDFVFERYFTGRIEKYADKPRAKSYAGLMPLDGLAVHIREALRLPGIEDRPTDIFERSDIALEKIEEHTLYLLQLHARVAGLESRCIKEGYQ